jgi:cytidine deaminase
MLRALMESIKMPKSYKLNPKDLVELARTAQLKAYAPYSRFKVGAALLAKNGRVYLGCNVENASYGLSCCAERHAVAAAVLDGQKEFQAIAIYSDSPGPTAPCGACRQVLNEFSPGLTVIMAGSGPAVRSKKLKELLPDSFGPRSLKT